MSKVKKKDRKLKPHDYMRSLTELEQDDWGEPEHNSNLVKTCHKLRKKPLNKFEAEDLRMLIGQEISLEILIPMAIKLLKEDIMVSGAFYDGDLLLTVLKKGKKYLKNNPTEKDEILASVEANKNRIFAENTRFFSQIDKLVAEYNEI